MPIYSWNDDKNHWLIALRGISFPQLVALIEQGHLLDVVRHPDAHKYPNQWLFVVQIDEYVWLVPFVESTEGVFLKTAFPSRKATKQYLRR
jgi:hypothetical protein